MNEKNIVKHIENIKKLISLSLPIKESHSNKGRFSNGDYYYFVHIHFKEKKDKEKLKKLEKILDEIFDEKYSGRVDFILCDNNGSWVGDE